MLSANTVARYLKDIVPFHIEPAPPPLIVPRRFLVNIYSAHGVFLLLKREDGRRSFIFPTQDVNPDMPVLPGEPGLILSSRLELLERTWTCFTQVTIKPVKWQYLGEYHCKVVGKLSADEFSQQRQKVDHFAGESLLTTHK